MKKKIVSLIACTLLTGAMVAGCGSAAGGAKVVHNGDYFVQIDDQVYFRSNPKDAIETSALGGWFDSSPTGKASSLMCYNTSTGEVTEAFSNEGCAEISYIDGRLFMFGAEGNMYSCLLDGSDRVDYDGDKKFFFRGIDNSTESLVLDVLDSEENFELQVWEKGQYKATIKEENESVSYVAAGDGYVVYSWGDITESEQHIGAYDIANNRQYALGKMPKTETQNGFEVFDHFVIQNGKVYFAGGNADGSMGVFFEGAIISAKLDTMDSMVVEKVLEFNDLELELPYITINDGQIELSEEKADTLKITEGNLYCVGVDEPIVKNFTDKNDYEGVVDMIEHQSTIGSSIYMIVNTMERDESVDVGWRPGYKRLATRYMKVDLTNGQVTVLSEQKCE